MHGAPWMLLAMVAAAGAATIPPITRVAIVPRADGYHAVVTMSNTVIPTAAAMLNLTIFEEGVDPPLLATLTNIPGYTDRLVIHTMDAGVLNTRPQNVVARASMVSRLYGSTPVQTFTVNATGASPLLGVMWMANANGTYTLTPIPGDWNPANARWSAVCSGVPPVLYAPWGSRTVAATATVGCSAQVSMDGRGYVVSDVMPVQGGWVNTSVVPAAVRSGARMLYGGVHAALIATTLYAAIGAL